MKNKTFSIKKLLLTILCSVIILVFIGNIALFLDAIPSWMTLEIVSVMDEDSEVLIEMGKSYEENVKLLEKRISEEKAKYGEDYPAEGIAFYKIFNIFSTYKIIGIFTRAVLLGIVLGVIIYIVFIQGAKGKQLILEVIVAFAVLFLMLFAINWGYKVIINKGINEAGVTDIVYDTAIYDIENNNNLVILYVGIFAIAYVVNLIKHKILTNKLNKELNNN